MLRKSGAILRVGNSRAAAAAVPYQLVGRPRADPAAASTKFLQRPAFVVVAIFRVERWQLYTFIDNLTAAVKNHGGKCICFTGCYRYDETPLTVRGKNQDVDEIGDMLELLPAEINQIKDRHFRA